MKISKNWRKMAKIYKIFAKDWIEICDFSEKSALEMYEYETLGKGNIAKGIFPNPKSGKYNGYAVGKRWMDIMIKLWKEAHDEGLFPLRDLYKDKKYPHWWLDRIFGKKYSKRFNKGGRNG